MAKKKSGFNPSKVQTSIIREFKIDDKGNFALDEYGHKIETKFEQIRTYKGKKLTKNQTKIFNEWEKRGDKVSKAYQRKIPKNIPVKYFSKGTRFTDAGGHLKGFASTLTAKGGKNAVQNFKQVGFYNIKSSNWTRTVGGVEVSGAVSTWKKSKTPDKWGIQRSGGVANKAIVLSGLNIWARQLGVAAYQVTAQADNFRIFVAHRAKKVFENSFKFQRFYSEGEPQWRDLADSTKIKRTKRGKGLRILDEYGDLKRSISVEEEEGAMKSRVFTEVVKADTEKHKYHSICYAGYHNEGEGHYGRTTTPYIKRQFMGHSTHLDPYMDPFIATKMKLFLFDAVFLAVQK